MLRSVSPQTVATLPATALDEMRARDDSEVDAANGGVLDIARAAVHVDEDAGAAGVTATNVVAVFGCAIIATRSAGRWGCARRLRRRATALARCMYAWTTV